MESRSGPVGIAVVGTGNVSPEYLKHLRRFPDLDLRWVCGRDQERAAARAEEFGVARFGALQDALSDDRVEIVVDLTTPAAHVPVGMAALAAGKHVWAEKPIGTDLASARRLLETARLAGLRVAGAPDTILGPVIQSVRRAIDSGEVGSVRFATLAFTSSGPESWHPNPEFLYADGAGPLLDIGPYLVASLVYLLGPVRFVAGVRSKPRSTRVIGSGPSAGHEFPVKTPTSVAATLELSSGAIAQVLVSFDAHGVGTSQFDVVGANATITAAPRGQLLEAPTLMRTAQGEEIIVPAVTTDFVRGLGVLDLARSIRAGTPERTPGQLGLHVLEVLSGIARAAEDHTALEISPDLPQLPLLDSDWDPLARTLEETIHESA